MWKYNYRNEKYKYMFGVNENDSDFNIQRPLFCPICGKEQVPEIIDRKLFLQNRNRRYGAICYRCSSCNEYYVVTYDINRKDRFCSGYTFCPQPSFDKYTDNDLEALSPRYVEASQQALNAESRGDIELAAIGYRFALECLVKDYAIKELKQPVDEVKGKALYNSLWDYLSEQKELLKSSDVVRILGNDYAHYDRKYPQYDFSVLKQYFEVFTTLLRIKFKANHPPVARKD